MKKYKVTLTKEERKELQTLLKKGKRKAQVIRNALIEPFIINSLLEVLR